MNKKMFASMALSLTMILSNMVPTFTQNSMNNNVYAREEIKKVSWEGPITHKVDNKPRNEMKMFDFGNLVKDESSKSYKYTNIKLEDIFKDNNEIKLEDKKYIKYEDKYLDTVVISVENGTIDASGIKDTINNNISDWIFLSNASAPNSFNKKTNVIALVKNG